MNISAISINNFYKVNCNSNQNAGLLNQKGISDCFVKSNKIAFCALSAKEQRQQKVDDFMGDLVKKVNSPKFSINDISNSMRKYVKNISVKPMSQAPKELLFSNFLQGLYCEELAFDESANKFLIPKKNRIFYTKTETLKQECGAVWVFVNAVHEFTHALQSEDSSLNKIDIFNKYVQDHKEDVDSATNQVVATVGTVNMIEEKIARPFINLLTRNENVAYTRVQTGQNDMLKWLCKKNGTEDFDAYVTENVNACIKASEEEQGINLDKKLLLDTTIKHFERELEAYSNENKAFKMCLRMDSPRALTRVQIYQKSIDIMKKMRKEVE